jgi:hypothetical protein
MTTNGLMGLEDFDMVAGSEEGAVMEVCSPKDGIVLRWPDGRPWTITVYGPDSQKLVELGMRQADRRAETFRRTNKMFFSAASMFDEEIEMLVEATKSWDMMLKDGTPAKNDPHEYRDAYVKNRWLREQVNKFRSIDGNFLKG